MLRNCCLALIVVLSVSACASRRGGVSGDFPAPRPRHAPPPAAVQAPASSNGANNANSPASGGTIVTPASPKVGRVSLVNGSAQYVIVTYAVGQLPVRDARLYAYRDGLKVAELKVTGFSRDINAAADIVAGECRVGDEVREP